MKKLLLFAAVAGLGLVSASPPNKGPDNGERETRRHYPPCSRTVTDRCTQLHERGVRMRPDREHHARGDRPGGDHADHRGHREHHAQGDRPHGDHRGHGDHADRRGHREQHAREDHAHDGHRDHREHHAGRAHREHAGADHRPAHRVAMAAGTARVASYRPRRHVARQVRRAGERG